MATPTITNGEEHFFPIIYEGNGGGQRVGKFVPFTDNGTIDNSVIFNDGDSAYLSRTPSSAGNRRTFTFSGWVKRGVFNDNDLFNAGTNSSNDIDQVHFDSNNRLRFYSYGVSAGAYLFQYITNRTFEDTSKFYHIVCAVDTTQSTASDRVKIYVDGDLITSFSTETHPALNGECYHFNNTNNHYIGASIGNARFLDGYIAEYNFVDGQALLPASFGLTDTSTGRWIPSVVKPYPTTTTTFTVTVSNPGSGNVYYIDSSQQATVTLIEGATYKFDQSDSSNSGHPLRFSTTSDGTHGGGSEYTTGVTTVGTPGSAGAYTEITVATGAPTLYYYCSNHSGMGGTANTQDQYGTNGFRLKFQDSSALGDDTSGNGNDFTATNLASTDQTTDSPTQNHATFDSNRNGGDWTLSEGNLKIVGTPSTGAGRICLSGMNIPNSNKIYWEVEADTINDSPRYLALFRDTVSLTAGGSTEDMRWLSIRNGGTADGDFWDGKSISSNLVTTTSGDIIQFARDGEKLWIGKNNTWLNSGNPSTGANPLVTNIDTNSNWKMGVWSLSTGLGGASHTFIMNAGQKTFSYTPPTGFSAWNQDNLPSTAKGISGLVWTKNRDSTDSNQLYDSSRGKQLVLASNATTAETTVTNGLQKFLAGGQQIEDNVAINTSGESFVSWNWVANSGTTSSNTDGSLTSTVQANTTAGFSIVQWTGDGGQSTVGHGLSGTPKVVIQKSLSLTSDWWFYTTALDGSYDYNKVNSTNAFTAISAGSAPTSTTFTSHGWSSSDNMVAYVFHEVEGYSKLSSYTGNGVADGPFVYTGFRPAFIMLKANRAANWYVHDSTRSTFNPVEKTLYWSLSNAEGTGVNGGVDFLSNGFKVRQPTGYGYNNSGVLNLYMAFAENPFVGDGTSPVTAR